MYLQYRHMFWLPPSTKNWTRCPSSTCAQHILYFTGWTSSITNGKIWATLDPQFIPSFGIATAWWCTRLNEFVVTFLGIRRVASAFIISRWYRFAHNCFDVTVLHKDDSLGSTNKFLKKEIDFTQLYASSLSPENLFYSSECLFNIQILLPSLYVVFVQLYLCKINVKKHSCLTKHCTFNREVWQSENLCLFVKNVFTATDYFNCKVAC